jgi:small subunit ribosomal protein S6
LREYETVFVLHPTLDEKEVEAEITAISELVTSTGGTVEEVERWGRRRLAYEIQKVHEATYTLIRFHGTNQTLKDLDRRFQLNEKLLRHLTVISEGPPPPPRAEGEGEGHDRRHEDSDFHRRDDGFRRDDGYRRDDGFRRSGGYGRREEGDFELPRSGMGRYGDSGPAAPRPNVSSEAASDKPEVNEN